MRYSPGKNKDFTTDIKYTYGKEYMYNTGVEYIGYHHVFKNKIYAGPSHTTKSNILLKYVKNNDVKKYISLRGQTNFNTPVEKLILPTESDYDIGWFNRYFIKQRNYSKIIEVNKQQYDSLKATRSGVNGKLYKGAQLIWKLTGSRNNIYKNDVIIHQGISDTNKRTITKKNDELSGLSGYLLNYLQFSRITYIQLPTEEKIPNTEYETIKFQERHTLIVSTPFQEEPWPETSNWILTTGDWNDAGIWVDTEVWID